MLLNDMLEIFINPENPLRIAINEADLDKVKELLEDKNYDINKTGGLNEQHNLYFALTKDKYHLLLAQKDRHESYNDIFYTIALHIAQNRRIRLTEEQLQLCTSLNEKTDGRYADILDQALGHGRPGHKVKVAFQKVASPIVHVFKKVRGRDWEEEGRQAFRDTWGLEDSNSESLRNRP